jgi:hypothetical protein
MKNQLNDSKIEIEISKQKSYSEMSKHELEEYGITQQILDDMAEKMRNLIETFGLPPVDSMIDFGDEDVPFLKDYVFIFPEKILSISFYISPI